MTEAHALVGANYDYDTGDVDYAGYLGEVQQAGAAYAAAYAQLLATYQQSVADQTLQPTSSQLTPPSGPESLGTFEQMQLDARAICRTQAPSGLAVIPAI